jgi:hypothetical protein
MSPMAMMRAGELCECSRAALGINPDPSARALTIVNAQRG